MFETDLSCPNSYLQLNQYSTVPRIKVESSQYPSIMPTGKINTEMKCLPALRLGVLFTLMLSFSGWLGPMVTDE